MTALTAATAEELELGGGTVAREQVSLWVDSWRRFRRNRLALAAAIYLFLLGIVAIVSLVWTPYSMSHIGVIGTYEGPTAAHPLGGDSLGRDILSRLMIGGRISLVVGLGTQAIVIVVGIVVGLVAGYFRGIVDTVLSLLINVFYGVPDLLVALILYVLLGGNGIGKIIIAISATRWMDMARLVRGQALSIREREFVEAARASGAKPAKILFGHILPNALGPIIVQATFGIPQAILFEAFLSFLGLGHPAAHPVMGLDGRRRHAGDPAGAPHRAWRPSIALSVTLLAFNFLGDGLRDAFDPGRSVSRRATALVASPILFRSRTCAPNFFTDDGVVKAVRDVSFDLYPGETLGIVGESGCGKSVTALSLMGLVQRPGKVVGGQVLFRGEDLLKLSSEEMREIRGRDIAMIFQDPLSSLNPVLKVGYQVEEAMLAHDKFNAATRRRSGRSSLLRAGADPRRQDAGQGLSPPAQRRHAPARDDRHGPRQRARHPHRRRAHHRARRHRPGPDPRAAAGPQPGDGHVDHADHPQPGRGGRPLLARDRHVRRPDRRGGPGRADLREPAAPIHLVAAAFPATHRLQPQGPPALHRGPAARPDPTPRRAAPSTRAAPSGSRNASPTTRPWSRSRPTSRPPAG